MQLEECLTEASREGRSRLSDATLCTSQLSGEAREEVVLGLLGSQDRYWGQYAEGVSRQEDNVLSVRTCALAIDLLGNLLDVVDRIAYTGVLCYALVSEVNLTVSSNCYVLQQCVALDGTIDVGLVLLAQVDNLCIAATLEVEYALVVPSVLVVADEQTLRVGRQSGLAGSRESEEDGGVLSFHVGVGRAVHRSNTLQRQVVVLHREHTLLHLTAIPCIDDNLLAACGVEGHAGLAVQAELLVVLNLSLRCVVDNEVGLEVSQLLFSGLDEHILNEVCLPSHLNDEAHGQTCSLVGTAESIDNIELLVAELLDGYVLDSSPHLFAHGVVVVLVFVRGPPNLVVALSIVNDVLILRRTTGVDTSHHVHCIELGVLALVEASQSGLCLLCEESLIAWVVGYHGRTGDAILCQI